MTIFTYNISLEKTAQKAASMLQLAKKHAHPMYALLAVAVLYNIFVPHPATSEAGEPIDLARPWKQEIAADAAVGFPEIDKAEPRVLKTMTGSTTYYASEYAQTSGNPRITASGVEVHWGVAANNCLPIGSKIRIRSQYGEQIFTVYDRMAPRWPCTKFDIWTDYSAGQNPHNGYGVEIEVIEVIPGVNS